MTTPENRRHSASQEPDGGLPLQTPRRPGGGRTAPHAGGFEICPECRQAVEPCVCDTSPYTEGPEEHCPQHGRLTSDWVRKYDEAQAAVNRALEHIEGREPHDFIGIARLRQILEGRQQ